MFRLGVKMLIVVILSTLLRAESQNVATTPPVIVTVKDYLKPQILSALNRDNQSDPAKSSANAGAGLFSTPRSKDASTVRELFACAIALDASCVVDRAEDIVDNANDNLLKQADVEARSLSARKEEAPSSLLSAIATMLLELPELLRESFNAFMKEGKLEVRAVDEESDEEDSEEEEGDHSEAEEDESSEEEDDDDDESEDEDKKKDKQGSSSEDGLEAKDGWNYINRKRCPKGRCQQSSSSSSSSSSGGGGGSGSGTGVSSFGSDDQNISYGSAGRKDGGGSGSSRGKKKKKKKAIVKLLLLGLVLKAKITLLLKMLAAKLQIKFLLIALANLLINLARFWWDLKKGHGEQPQKVIYYEHAQHQHHYDGGEDWHGSSPGGGSGGYWARAYDSEEDKKSAQDIAYSKYAPPGTTYSRIDDKPNISWNPPQKSYY